MILNFTVNKKTYSQLTAEATMSIVQPNCRKLLHLTKEDHRLKVNDISAVNKISSDEIFCERIMLFPLD